MGSCQDSGECGRGGNHHRRDHQFADAREEVPPESQGGRPEKSPERLPQIEQTGNPELDVPGDRLRDVYGRVCPSCRPGCP